MKQTEWNATYLGVFKLWSSVDARRRINVAQLCFGGPFSSVGRFDDGLGVNPALTDEGKTQKME